MQFDLSVLDGRNVSILGAEASHLRTDDFFDVSPRATYLAALAQNDLRLLKEPALWLNTGIRFEQIQSDNGGELDVQYSNVNPRAALVLNVDNQHSVRTSIATAYRTPTPFENFSNIGAALPIHRYLRRRSSSQIHNSNPPVVWWWKQDIVDSLYRERFEQM